jgi:hypothetical protein
MGLKVLSFSIKFITSLFLDFSYAPLSTHKKMEKQILERRYLHYEPLYPPQNVPDEPYPCDQSSYIVFFAWKAASSISLPIQDGDRLIHFLHKFGHGYQNKSGRVLHITHKRNSCDFSPSSGIQAHSTSASPVSSTPILLPHGPATHFKERGYYLVRFS